MRRIAAGLIVVTAILLVAQIRLSRSEPIPSEPPPPALWERSQPPGRWSPSPDVTQSPGGLVISYPSPTTNCVMLISIDPSSQYELTSAEAGVLFDIDADGDLDRVAWTDPASEVALLALDRDGDGRITNGSELVGDHTLPGVTNGMAALSRLVGQPALWSMVTSDDPVFAKLRLWRDRNHNGKADQGELVPAEVELATIGLGYGLHRRMDSHGNQSRSRGFVHVRTAPGRNDPRERTEDLARLRDMYIVCLAVQESR